MKKCIVVLGMHRSGTSAFAGVLSYMGVYLGPDIMNPSEDNPKGFFENEEVYKLNEKILHENASSWDDLEFDANTFQSIATKYIEEAKAVIKDQFQYSNTFAIKDPRNCLLFAVWEKALLDLNVNIEVAIPYRNPLEVANSLRKRNNFSFEKSLILWIVHFLNAEYVSRSYKRIFVSFEDLVSNEDEIINHIASTFELNIVNTLQSDLDEFLESNLKHHNFTYDNISEHLPQFIQEILKQLMSRNFDDHLMFDRIREDFMYNRELFFNKDVLNSLHIVSDKVKNIENNNIKITHFMDDNEKLSVKLKEKNDNLESIRLRVEELQIEVEEKNGWAFKLKTNLSRIEEELIQSQEAFTQSQTELVQSQEAFTQSQTELVQSQEDLAKSKSELLENKTKVIELEDKNKFFIAKVDKQEKAANSYYEKSRNIEAFQHLFLKYKEGLFHNFFSQLPRNRILLTLNLYSLLRKVLTLKKKMKDLNHKFNRITRKFIEEFKAGDYLEANKDVLDAVENKLFENALEHYILHGFDEINNGTRALYLCDVEEVIETAEVRKRVE